MKDEELRRLRREDLLLILIDQQKRIDDLTEALKEREKEIEKRRITIEKSGSLAEAAFRLNDVYTITEKAAATYLNEIRARADEMLAQARQKAEEIGADAEGKRREAEETLEKARVEAEAIREEARKAAMRQRALAAGQAEESAGRSRGLFARRKGQ